MQKVQRCREEITICKCIREGYRGLSNARLARQALKVCIHDLNSPENNAVGHSATGQYPGMTERTSLPCVSRTLCKALSANLQDHGCKFATSYEVFSIRLAETQVLHNNVYRCDQL